MNDTQTLNLIREVYGKIVQSEPDWTHGFGTQVAELIGTIASNGVGRDYFEPLDRSEQEFMSVMTELFPYDHAVWKFLDIQDEEDEFEQEDCNV